MAAIDVYSQTKSPLHERLLDQIRLNREERLAKQQQQLKAKGMLTQSVRTGTCQTRPMDKRLLDQLRMKPSCCEPHYLLYHRSSCMVTLCVQMARPSRVLWTV